LLFKSLLTSYSCWTYFDIETEGLNPEEDKIITIQYQSVAYDESGNRVSDFKSSKTPAPGLHILKEWELSEKIILMKLYNTFLTPNKRYQFEPVGNNLAFEGRFLKSRFRKHSIIDPTENLRFGQLRIIDLYPLMILVNNGYPTTAKFFGKVGENKKIASWYKDKEFCKIEKYVNDETRSFMITLDYLVKNLPTFRSRILALHL